MFHWWNTHSLSDALDFDMTAPSTYRGVQPCGTPGAAGRHRYYGEDLCDECKKAEARRMRQQRRGERPSRKRPRHGTVSGYRHLHPDGNRCRPCLDAMAEYNRKWRAGKLRSNERMQRTTSADLILDVLETYGYAMTADVLVSHVIDIKPAWKESSVRRALFRMVADGRVHQVERLGEWLYEVSAVNG